MSGRRCAEQDLVGGGAEHDIIAETAEELGIEPLARMRQPDAARQQVRAGHVPAQPHHRGHQELDLVPIVVPADAAILDRKADMLAIDEALRDAFVDDRAVARGALQRLVSVPDEAVT